MLVGQIRTQSRANSWTLKSGNFCLYVPHGLDESPKATLCVYYFLPVVPLVCGTPLGFASQQSHTIAGRLHNMPLRDPFATEDDEPSTSALGRPPRRIPGAGHPAPDRGANTNSAPRSLGLSLGVPRSRMVVKRDNEVDTAVESSVARQADDAVRNTDSDALLSRLSALKLGYLPSEPFTQEFSSNQQSSGPQGAGPSSLSRPSQPGGSARRSPLINIGTYLRCTTIDREVESFLKQGIDPKQIISIGAGSDTRYWRIMVSIRPTPNPPDIK